MPRRRWKIESNRLAFAQIDQKNSAQTATLKCLFCMKPPRHNLSEVAHVKEAGRTRIDNELFARTRAA